MKVQFQSAQHRAQSEVVTVIIEPQSLSKILGLEMWQIQNSSGLGRLYSAYTAEYRILFSRYSS